MIRIFKEDVDRWKELHWDRKRIRDEHGISNALIKRAVEFFGHDYKLFFSISKDSLIYDFYHGIRPKRSLLSKHNLKLVIEPKLYDDNGPVPCPIKFKPFIQDNFPIKNSTYIIFEQ